MSLKYQAIAFDCYGTLCQIRQRTHPYRAVLRSLGLADLEWTCLALTERLSFSEFVTRCGNVNEVEMWTLTQQLEEELASVALYEDALPCIQQLQHLGLRIGVLSNLALPYVAPADRLLPSAVEVRIWSCLEGIAKPDPRIFWRIASCLDVDPMRVLVVGDSLRADIEGSKQAGLSALLLDRKNASSTTTAISSLDDLEGYIRYA